MRQAFSYLLGFLAGLWEAASPTADEGAYIDPLG
jgi:hypothetical protein